MDWNSPINAYCERLDPSFWSEPINAITNLAFIIAAIWVWPRSKGLPLAQALTAILFIIGVGSFLFHTFATPWAALMDVAPIGAFILLYLFAVHRDIIGLGFWKALAATTLFFPFAAIVVPVINWLPFVGISGFYWTVPILLTGYGLALHNKPGIRQGFLTGAAILGLSITARSLDETLCNALPIGTHFLWHVLNGVMLGYMIIVYCRHMLAGGARGR
ncbi:MULTISPECIES: ceramidase domain-containing protein [unclassified Yoonia]|uniref:ceramidase domain-containing protein n=1 Tax=unclassified Yoonia TaxID=2629118 RepID=UPI002AFE3935|nr:MULTISPECIES: ceramidase domain-containing protein [unclassified Yoonia]